MKTFYPLYRSRIQLMISALEKTTWKDTQKGFIYLNTACRNYDRNYIVDACESLSHALTLQPTVTANYVGMGFVWILVGDINRASSYYELGCEVDNKGYGLSFLKVSLKDLTAYLEAKGLQADDLNEVFEIVDLDIFRFLLRLKENLIDISIPSPEKERIYWLESLIAEYNGQHNAITNNIQRLETVFETAPLYTSLQWAESILWELKDNLRVSKELKDINENHLEKLQHMLFELFRQQKSITGLIEKKDLLSLENQMENILDKYAYASEMIEHLKSQQYDLSQVESYQRIIGNYIDVLQEQLDSF